MMSDMRASSDQEDRLDCQIRIEELQTLLAAQRAITSSLEPNLVVQLIADEARRIISGEMSAVYLYKKNRLEICALSGGFQKSLLGYAVPVEQSLAGKVSQSGQSLLLEDTQNSERQYSPVLERFWARAILVAPLSIEKRAVGAVLVANNSPGSLGPDDLRLLEMMAAGAAVAVDNAQRYIFAQQTAALEERQRLERKLQGAVSQTLFSASLIADVLPRLWDLDPSEGRTRMEELRQITRGALVEVRRLLMDD